MQRRRRKPGRPPHDEELILSWADEHYELNGVWPTSDPCQVAEHDGENWHAIDMALRRGYRGLLPHGSLSNLLEARRGVPNQRNQPRLTIETILLWADQYFAAHGSYPTPHSGKIAQAPTETWACVESALIGGWRGLAVGSSLAKLLQAHRGKRNGASLPPISIEDILSWADDHFSRTGKWPHLYNGAICATHGERWSAVNSALRHGKRGFPGNSSLLRVLIEHRGKEDVRELPPYTVDMIAEWLRLHASRHGRYPNSATGAIEDAPGESWGAVQIALTKGHRGLPGGSTLAKLRRHLILEGKVQSLGEKVRYNTETITLWMSAYYARNGSYPTAAAGIIVEAPAESWIKVDGALKNGCRGLPGDSSLAKLREKLISEGKLQRITTTVSRNKPLKTQYPRIQNR